jgi:hypothetical protein
LLAKKKKNRQFRILITCNSFYKNREKSCQEPSRIQHRLINPRYPWEDISHRRPPHPEWKWTWKPAPPEATLKDPAQVYKESAKGFS